MKKSFTLLCLVLITGCATYQNDLSDTSTTSATSSREAGLLIYAVGSSGGKVDWIVIAKGNLDESVSIGTGKRMYSEKGKRTEEYIMWEGRELPLHRNAGLVYDRVLDKRLPLRTGLTLSECEEIFKKRGHQVTGVDFAR